MMSPGPPPPPIFPRETSLSTVSEPPRPLHATTFSSNQLPPPLSGGGYAPRTYGGPHLAPIPISATSSGGSATHQQHQSAPHPQHTIPSPHPSTPYLPSTQSDANFRRGYLPDRFTSPASPSPYSPASYPYDQRPEHASTRRFSHEHSPENRGERPSLPAMIPSPAYTIKRSSEELYQDEQPYTSSRYTPTSAEDSGNYRPEMPHNRSSGRYRITVRQQPVAARACGFGERDRRVIDPPPIVQLLVTDSTGRPDSAELRYPFNVVHCTLWSVDGLTDETALTGQDKRHTRRLMGTLVSSPFVGTDEEGKEGCFFCFPDLSCRTHGKYRLRFVLMRLEPSELSPEGCTPIITETMSEPFTVYTAKEFPGMRPSTALTKALKRQGCAISVKKGNEKTTGSGDEDDKVDSRTSSAPRKRIRNGDK